MVEMKLVAMINGQHQISLLSVFLPVSLFYEKHVDERVPGF